MQHHDLYEDERYIIMTTYICGLPVTTIDPRKMIVSIITIIAWARVNVDIQEVDICYSYTNTSAKNVSPYVKIIQVKPLCAGYYYDKI